MERNIVIFSYETAIEIRKVAIYRTLISYLVPELQSFKDTKVKVTIVDMKHRNKSKLIKFMWSHALLVDLVNN